MDDRTFDDAEKIFSILRLAIVFGDLGETGFSDPAIPVGDLFQHCDLDVLALLYDFYEFIGSSQRIDRARVQPGESASEYIDIEVARIHVHLIDIRDLEFASRARFDLFGEIDDPIIVKI